MGTPSEREEALRVNDAGGRGGDDVNPLERSNVFEACVAERGMEGGCSRWTVGLCT